MFACSGLDVIQIGGNLYVRFGFYITAGCLLTLSYATYCMGLALAKSWTR